MAAYRAPVSLEFSRQEHWSGLPFPSPVCEREVTQSCPTFSDPMDCSLPGSSVHGIVQARVLEWDAIAFSIVSSVVSDSVLPQRWQPTRLRHPWDSPGKNTGVGCHFLLQCMKVKSEIEVTQSCLTLCDPTDGSLPGPPIQGVF